MSHATLLLPDAESHWLPVRDGHQAGKALHRRHYSARATSTSKLFVGPGGKLVLLTPDAKALFVWRRFIDDCIDARTGQKQQGVNCAAFRNENSELLSSELLLQAEVFAWARWPGERLYTYVNPKKIRSENPGCCFKKAGWKRCGTDQKGKLIFEKLPAPDPAQNQQSHRCSNTGGSPYSTNSNHKLTHGTPFHQHRPG